MIHDRSGSRERGITLVETLAAVLILGLVAMAVMTMFTQGMALNATGADYTQLTNAAKDKAEELMALDYHATELLPDVLNTEAADPLQPELSPQITWQVAEHYLSQAADNPAAAWGGNPLVSTAAGVGAANLKVIRVTATSRGLVQLGRRDATVIAVKSSPQVTPTPAPTATPSP